MQKSPNPFETIELFIFRLMLLVLFVVTAYHFVRSHLGV